MLSPFAKCAKESFRLPRAHLSLGYVHELHEDRSRAINFAETTVVPICQFSHTYGPEFRQDAPLHEGWQVVVTQSI